MVDFLTNEQMMDVFKRFIQNQNDHLLLKKFLDNNPDYLTLGTPEGFTLLDLAVRYEQFAVVDYLARRGAAAGTIVPSALESLRFLSAVTDRTDNACKWSLLHWAAIYGQLGLVEYLVSQGADINTTNYSGQTPLHLGVFNGHVGVVQYLLQQGAETPDFYQWINPPENRNLMRHNPNVFNAIILLLAHEEKFDPAAFAEYVPNSILTPYFLAQYLLLHNKGRPLGSEDYKEDYKNVFIGLKNVYPIIEAARNNHPPTPMPEAWLKNSFYRELIYITHYLYNNRPLSSKEKSENKYSTARTDVFAQRDMPHRIVFSTTQQLLDILELSIQNDNLFLEQFLERNPYYITQPNIDGDTLLHVAASNERYLPLIECLLHRGADINITNNLKQMPLDFALTNKAFAVVEYLARQGAVNFITYNNEPLCPLLHWAAKHGQLSLVEYLVSQGASINKPNNRGETPLYYAVFNGHVDVVRYLLQKGAATPDFYQWINPPENHNLMRHNPNIFNAAILLLAHQEAFDIRKFAQYVESLLWGQYLLAKYLLSCNAGRPFSDSEEDYENIATWLTEVYVITVPEWNNKPPLMLEDWLHSLLHRELIYIVQYLYDNRPVSAAQFWALGNLVEEGILVPIGEDAKDAAAHRFTNLMIPLPAELRALIAQAARGLPGVKTIPPVDYVRARTDVLKQIQGEMPHRMVFYTINQFLDILKLSIENRYFSLKEFLDDNPDYITQSNIDGCTLLHVASRSVEYIPLIECLVHQGADINRTNNEGQTPFLFAVSRGLLAVVECLVRLGADINKANNKGEMPLFFAVSGGHVDVVQYLLQKNAATPNFYQLLDDPLHHDQMRDNSDILKAVVLLLAHEKQFDFTKVTKYIPDSILSRCLLAKYLLLSNDEKPLNSDSEEDYKNMTTWLTDAFAIIVDAHNEPPIITLEAWLDGLSFRDLAYTVQYLYDNRPLSSEKTKHTDVLNPIPTREGVPPNPDKENPTSTLQPGNS